MASLDPRGLEFVDSSSIGCLEGGSSELWLVSFPSNGFPMDKLDGMSVTITSDSPNSITQIDERFALTVKHKDQTSGAADLMALQPTREMGGLEFAKRIKGHITVNKSVPLTQFKPPVVVKPHLLVSEDLRQRWVPFGIATKRSSKESNKPRKGKKRKRMEE